MLFDSLQSIGAAQPRICACVINRFFCKNVLDGFIVSERNLLKPIHHLTQVILIDFEAEREGCQRLPIRFRPTKPTLQSLPPKSPLGRVSLDLALSHALSPARIQQPWLPSFARLAPAPACERQRQQSRLFAAASLTQQPADCSPNSTAVISAMPKSGNDPFPI